MEPGLIINIVIFGGLNVLMAVISYHDANHGKKASKGAEEKSADRKDKTTLLKKVA
jgi:hypothetical protein